MTKTNELTAAAEFLSRKFPHGGRVLCAVSGGLDSMCLLDYMTRQPGFSVAAAHFNHGLRGPEADRDEEFVRDYCAKRRIPFVSGSGDTRAFAEKESLSIEEAARPLRVSKGMGSSARYARAGPAARPASGPWSWGLKGAAATEKPGWRVI